MPGLRFYPRQADHALSGRRIPSGPPPPHLGPRLAVPPLRGMRGVEAAVTSRECFRDGGHVHLFEFKVAELSPPGSAMAQLQSRRHADKYRDRGEPIHLAGVELSRATRNVTAFEVADG